MPYIAPNQYECPLTRKVYSTGCLPPKHDTKDLRAYAETGMPIYTRTEIAAQIKAGRGNNSKWSWVILNQTSHPWCWCFGATQVLMMTINKLFGRQVILDPTLGVKVTGETGGNAIDAMLLEVQTKFGAIPAAFSGNDPVGGNVSPNRIPANWKETAAKLLVPEGEWVVLNSFEELASANINGLICNVGLNWDGGGHDVAEDSVSVASNGQLVFSGDNSWSPDFTSGFGAEGPKYPGRWSLPESRIRDMFDGNHYGAYALGGCKDLDVT